VTTTQLSKGNAAAEARGVWRLVEVHPWVARCPSDRRGRPRRPAAPGVFAKRKHSWFVVLVLPRSGSSSFWFFLVLVLPRSGSSSFWFFLVPGGRMCGSACSGCDSQGSGEGCLGGVVPRAPGRVPRVPTEEGLLRSSGRHGENHLQEEGLQGGRGWTKGEQGGRGPARVGREEGRTGGRPVAADVRRQCHNQLYAAATSGSSIASYKYIINLRLRRA
jgi:hypothetical protein